MTAKVNWKKVDGWPYSVSNKGKVCRTSIGSKMNAWKLLIPWIKDGYPTVSLYKFPKKPRKVPVHRLVAEAFLPRIKGMNVVNHLDENRQNNSVDNLEWTNKRGNAIHTYKSKPWNKDKWKGENNAASKLNNKIVKKIRGLYLLDFSAKDIARMMNLNYSTVWDAATERTWKHV